jgi:hypothetical protein
MHRFGAHLGDEFVRIFVRQVLVVFWNIIQDIQVFFFGQQVTLNLCSGFLDTALDHHIRFHSIRCSPVSWSSPKQVTDLVRQALEVPDMNYRHHQFDVAHALTTYFLLGYFHTATVAHDTLVTDTLVLTAAHIHNLLPVQKSFAEQTITFRLVRTVVDGFRFQYFTKALSRMLSGEARLIVIL